MFPSPHSGILFLYAAAFMFDGNGGKFPSPHSGILFLWLKKVASLSLPLLSFRPLIRGFFFYLISAAALMFNGNGGFPSPHSGILFL